MTIAKRYLLIGNRYFKSESFLRNIPVKHGFETWLEDNHRARGVIREDSNPLLSPANLSELNLAILPLSWSSPC
jgi:hypothetical protein